LPGVRIVSYRSRRCYQYIEFVVVQKAGKSVAGPFNAVYDAIRLPEVSRLMSITGWILARASRTPNAQAARIHCEKRIVAHISIPIPALRVGEVDN